MTARDGGRQAVPEDGAALASGAEVGGGLPTGLGSTRIGSSTFMWGTRTFLMGIINATPDSFSGDGLLADQSTGSAPAASAVRQAIAMAEGGADLLDIGGESTRPGHAGVDEADEIAPGVPRVPPLPPAA